MVYYLGETQKKNEMKFYKNFQMDERQGEDPWYPREQWDSFEPMLLSEGAFAAGMIFR